ncbi:MAG: helix-turn-helix domain-containing protein [Phenylobacterium sp.]
MALAYDYTDVQVPSTAHRAAEAAHVLPRVGLSMAFAKDEEIYGQDEATELVYRVLEGAIRTTRVMADGRRQIGDFYLAGEIFGLETGSRRKFAAEAVSDSVVLVFKASALRGAGGDFERLAWDTTRRELERAQEHVLLLGRRTACERVASFLKSLAEKSRVAGVVDLPMGRQDMADYLGLTIETVSRMLSQLQSSRIVSFCTTRQFRVINPQGLARMADQDQ